MKDGGWIPIDERLKYLLPKGGEYTFLEAYVSLRCDIQAGEEKTINGYSRMWSWSRNKVRNFVAGLRTGKGHVVDNQRTGKGQEIRIFIKELEEVKDRQGTGKGQARDRQGTTTIKNKNKEKPLATEPPPERSEHKLFITWFCYAYKKVLNREYSFAGGKDGKLVSGLLQTVPDLSRLVVKTCHFLLDEKIKSHGIGFLSYCIGDLNYSLVEVSEKCRDLGIIPPKGVRLKQWIEELPNEKNNS